MIRDAGPGDVAATYAIYFDAVRNGTAPHYTAAEARAWAPTEVMEPWWLDRITSGRTWIAELHGRPAGFLTVADSHLDFFFVRADAHGSGLGCALYDTFLADARARGRTALTTHASHLARRFLEPRGWTVLDQEVAVRNGVPLTRFAMRLTLPPATE